MRKLYITLITVLAMGCLVPLAGSMASSEKSPFYTHFVYMFGHANFLHWVINGWAMMVLHNLFRPHRLEVCYILAVILSFIPDISVGSGGLLGASVITTFFFGFLTPHIRRTDKASAYMMLALILVGFFIPGIAALPHLLMYLCGIGYFYLEGLLLHFLRFCKS